MPIATINGVKLNYVQLDDGGGPAREDLVMVHGLATNMAFWYFRYGLALAKRFRVTLYDLRGHGRSEMPATGYSPAILAADLGGLMDQLRIDKAHLMAHSFGGVVALNFACASPERVRSLVLADSHFSAGREVQEREAWSFSQQVQPVLDRMGAGLSTSDPYFGPGRGVATAWQGSAGRAGRSGQPAARQDRQAHLGRVAGVDEHDLGRGRDAAGRRPRTGAPAQAAGVHW